MLSPLRTRHAPQEAVLSLEVQARMAATDPEQADSFRLLVRHFLERFFNNEMASADGEGKKRLIQVALAVGLPGFILAMYLYPPYHDIRAPRPYWAQVGDHYFFVMYSLVALAIVTIFEWDFFFPDRLDVFVLSTLPIKARQLFLARITAIAIFIVGFLFDSNFLAPLVLPASTDPPHLARFLTAHLLSVTLSGIFAAALVLAIQGVLLATLGERLFRKVSLPLQALSITALFTLLLLSPVLAGTLREWLSLKSAAVLYLPPFWFLGLYQYLLEGSSALSVFARLAQIACTATALAVAVAVVSYPFAYLRRTRQLVEGSGKGRARRGLSAPLHQAFHAALFFRPLSRAMSDYIGQTLLRVPRYRIYLVMYGGLGVAIIAASVVRFHFAQAELRFGFSADGLRAAVPIVAFWTIAGLRASFLAPADQKGKWIFRVIQGKPHLDQFLAVKHWTQLWGTILSLATVALVHMLAPLEAGGWRAAAVQALVAIALCMLLADAFFLRVKIIPFTGMPVASPTNMAFILIQYLGLFPPLILITLGLEPLLETSLSHLLVAGLAVALAHTGLVMIHRRIVAEYTQQKELDDDEEEFPQSLGLRY